MASEKWAMQTDEEARRRANARKKYAEKYGVFNEDPGTKQIIVKTEKNGASDDKKNTSGTKGSSVPNPYTKYGFEGTALESIVNKKNDSNVPQAVPSWRKGVEVLNPVNRAISFRDKTIESPTKEALVDYALELIKQEEIEPGFIERRLAVTENGIEEFSEGLKILNTINGKIELTKPLIEKVRGLSYKKIAEIYEKISENRNVGTYEDRVARNYFLEELKPVYEKTKTYQALGGDSARLKYIEHNNLTSMSEEEFIDNAKYEYELTRRNNPSLPEFGSYEYFVDRGKELETAYGIKEDDLLWKDQSEARRIADELKKNGYYFFDIQIDKLNLSDEEKKKQKEAARENPVLYKVYLPEKAYKLAEEDTKVASSNARRLYQTESGIDLMEANALAMDYFGADGVHLKNGATFETATADDIDIAGGKKEAQTEKDIWKPIEDARHAQSGHLQVYADAGLLNDEKLNDYEMFRTAEKYVGSADSKIDAYDYAEKYKDNTYGNNIGGVWGLNYRLGDIGVKQNEAGAVARDFRSDDVEAADVYDILQRTLIGNNKETYNTDDKWWKSSWASIAQNAPQMIGQTKEYIKGYLAAGISTAALTYATTGTVNLSLARKVGDKVGDAATAAYMFRQTAGGAYYRELKKGLSVEDAYALSGKEAALSAVVEYGMGRLVSYAGGKVVGEISTETGEVVAGALVKKLLKSGMSEKGAKTVIRAADFVAGNLGEGAEEWLQEGASITAERIASEGRKVSLLEYAVETLDLSNYSSEEFERMNDSFKAGFVVGTFHSATRIGIDAGVTGVSATLSKKDSKSVRTAYKMLKSIDEAELGKSILAGEDAKSVVNKGIVHGRISNNADTVALANGIYNKMQSGEELSASDVGKLSKQLLLQGDNFLAEKSADEVHYLIEYDDNGHEYWKIESDKDIFKGLATTKELQKAAYNYILRGNKGTEVTGLIDGEDLKFIRISAEEYLYGEASNELSNQEYNQKMRMAPSITDLIKNASITYDAPDHKSHKMFPDGFKNYQGRVGIDGNIFRYIVRVGKARDGKIFYDINLEADVRVPDANGTSPIKKSASNINSIPQNSKNSNKNVSDMDKIIAMGTNEYAKSARAKNEKTENNEGADVLTSIEEKPKGNTSGVTAADIISGNIPEGLRVRLESFKKVIERMGFTVIYESHRETPKNTIGYVDFTNREVYLSPANIDEALLTHELTHIIDKGFSGKYVQSLTSFFKNNLSEEWDKKYNEVKAKYEGIAKKNEGFTYTDSTLEAETLAEMCTEFTTDEYIKKAANMEVGTIKQVIVMFNYVRAKLKSIFIDTSSDQKFKVASLKWQLALYKATKKGEARGSGSYYLFGGRTALTANESLYQEALKLQKKGATPQKIWEETHWKKGLDGKWRFEIDDSEAVLVPVPEGTRSVKLGDILIHDELYKAYPQLKDMEVVFAPMPEDKGVGGAYHPAEKRIYITSDMLKGNVMKELNGECKGLFIHEIQHAIQDIEGFEFGGNLDDAIELERMYAADYLSENDATFRKMTDQQEGFSVDKINEYIDNYLKKKYNLNNINDIKYAAYERLLGEREAQYARHRAEPSGAARERTFPDYDEGALLWNENVDKSRRIFRQADTGTVASAENKEILSEEVGGSAKEESSDLQQEERKVRGAYGDNDAEMVYDSTAEDSGAEDAESSEVAELEESISLISEALNNEELSRTDRVALITERTKHRKRLAEIKGDTDEGKVSRRASVLEEYNETGDPGVLPSEESLKASDRYDKKRIAEIRNEFAQVQEALRNNEGMTEFDREDMLAHRDSLVAQLQQIAENNSVLSEIKDIVDGFGTGEHISHEWVNDVSPDVSDPTVGGMVRQGVYNTNDVERNFKRFFGKHYGEAYEKVLKPFYESKKAYAEDVVKYAKLIREEVVKKLGIKEGTKESAAVMWLGEGKRPLTKKELAADLGRVGAKRLRKQIKKGEVSEQFTEYTYEDCVKEFGKAKADNILAATKVFRKCYDELIAEINKVRAEIYPNNPDKLIKKRADYFRHFNEISNSIKGLRAAVANNQGIDPTLVGVSEYTEPKSKFMSAEQQRTGNKTTYDAVGGFLDYLMSAEYAIHIDKNIVNFRSLARDLALAKSEEGAGAGNPNANGFIRYLQRFANHLAGKTVNSLDRAIADMPHGRQMLAVLNWVNNRAKANAVLGNISSVVAQVSNIKNAVGKIDKTWYLWKGAAETFGGIFGRDNKIKRRYDESGFLKERFMGDKLKGFDTFSSKVWHAPKDFAAWVLGFADEVGTRITYNAAYNQALARKVENPAEYADSFTRSCVAGRGIGDVPLVLQSQVAKLFLPFRVEVLNDMNVRADILFGGDYWQKQDKGKKAERRKITPDMAESRRLTEDDIDKYINAGTRKNNSKKKALADDKKIILATEKEITDFIHNSINDADSLNTVGYGIVNDRLYKDVESYSSGKIDIKDNFLELIPYDIQHAYNEHLKAKENGDIDLSMKDFENIPSYIDHYDDIVYAIRYENGNTRICLSKKLPNGRVLIIETVSKSRGSIAFKNMIGVSEEKYINLYEKKYKKGSSTNTRGGKNPNISLRDETASKNSIPQNTKNINKKVSTKTDAFDELVAMGNDAGDGKLKLYKRMWRYGRFLIFCSVMNALLAAMKGDGFSPVDDMEEGFEEAEEEGKEGMDKILAGLGNSAGNLWRDYIDGYGDGVAYDPLGDIATGIYEGMSEGENTQDDVTMSVLRSFQNLFGDYLSNNPFAQTAIAATGADEDVLDKVTNGKLYTPAGGGSPVFSTLWTTAKELTDGDYATAGKEVFTDFVMPWGGSQIDKSVRGMYEYKTGYATTENAYERMAGKEGKLKYLIKPNQENFIKSLLFGPASFGDANDYYYTEDEYKLTEDDTKEVLKEKDYKGRKTKFDEIVSWKRYKDERKEALDEREAEYYGDNKDSALYSILYYTDDKGEKQRWDNAVPYGRFNSGISITVDDRKVKGEISVEKAKEMNALMGERLEQWYDMLNESEDFAKLSDESKQAIVTSIYNIENDYMVVQELYRQGIITDYEYQNYGYDYVVKCAEKLTDIDASVMEQYAEDALEEWVNDRENPEKFAKYNAANTARLFLDEAYFMDEETKAEVERYYETESSREPDDVDKELARLSYEVRDKIYVYSNPYNILKFQKGGVNYALRVPAEDIYGIFETADAQVRKNLATLIRKSSYQNASDEEKAEMVSSVRNKVQGELRKRYKTRYPAVRIEDAYDRSADDSVESEIERYYDFREADDIDVELGRISTATKSRVDIGADVDDIFSYTDGGVDYSIQVPASDVNNIFKDYDTQVRNDLSSLFSESRYISASDADKKKMIVSVRDKVRNRIRSSIKLKYPSVKMRTLFDRIVEMKSK